MNHKGVWSQGDFGVDKIDKQSADLALLKKSKMAGRVVNLSKIQPGELINDAKEAKEQRRGRTKRLTPKIKKNAREAGGPMTLFKQFPQSLSVSMDPLEVSYPERSEIITAMEEIEATNNFLRNYSWRVNEADAVLDLPGIVDVEKYLWLEEAMPPANEPDILTDLLAEPDLESLYESPDEIKLSLPQARGRLEGGAENNKETIFYDSFLTGEKSNFPFVQDELVFKQSDFLARWRQKRKRSEGISLIPNSRKFWRGRNDAWPLESRFQEEESSWCDRRKVFLWRGLGFLGAGLAVYLIFFGLSLTGQGLLAKHNILSSALQAYKSMLAAKDSAVNLNFDAASVNFETAYQNFLAADQELNKMGRGIIYILEKLPGGSQVSSGASLLAAGENLAKAGQSFTQIAKIFLVQNLSDYFVDNGPSLTQKMAEAQNEINQAQLSLGEAAKNLNDVDVSDLPSDLAPQIASLKEKMPPVLAAAGQLKNWSGVLLEVFGHERTKKYLLVFQNNSEARPTGGFIGTYGLVDLDKGRTANLFIDGIFNLDGQLFKKVIPPRPIQKISTAWSTHDANWFADWPTSAEKIIGFYEAAGGSTPDGVISLTPTIIERLLEIIGPINMSQYNVVLDQNNFLDVTQYKVEVDYDKQLNQPKKILADFAPVFLDKLWEIWPQKGGEIMEVILDSLSEKHVLFYFSSPTLQKVFVDQGWTGEVLATEKDYLNVINTNINGYKTDRVVEQKIYHTASVQDDGSIIDTVRIIREHHGGKNQYDWYNKVNADYLRVYVPLGSKLISAQGQVLEAYKAPIDYQAQNFKVDADVQAQEQGPQIDQSSGTQIFEESGKTVFGNWTYVSPGETKEITYRYLLPFKINLSQDSASYSLMTQKQSGSIGSDFTSVLQLPKSVKITWQYPAELEFSGNEIKFSDNLQTDKFYGVVLGK